MEFNGDNQIYGLAEPTASNSPVRLQYIESGYYNLSGDTLEASLNVDDNDINNFFDSGCGSGQAVKDVYNNGTLVCGEAGGSLGLPDVLDSNNTADKFMDMNTYTIRNLGAPEGNLDAVRRQDITGMLNRTNGTLAGTLDFNGYNAELSNGCLSNDGNDEGIKVDDSGNVEITGELGLQETPVSNIGMPQDNRDAVRQGQLSDYYNLSGDTLGGNLELGGNEIQDNSGDITLGGSDVEIPDGNLEINGGVFEVNSTGYVGPRIISRDSKWTCLDFGDADDQNAGSIQYRHGEGAGSYSDTFTFTTGGTNNQFIIDSEGNIEVPNGNINLNGNNVTSTGNQELCAGDMC